MKDLTPKAIAGTWRGRLIDVRGLEGELTLELSANRGRAKGIANAAIGATHETERRRVKLQGKYGDDALTLFGVVDERAEVDLAIDVKIFELAGGGHGMCGTYRVSARSFSPLRAGVIAASKGERITASEVHPELVLNRRETAGGPR
jgi:hypothetical protein